jgi:hypothetical protein
MSRASISHSHVCHIWKVRLPSKGSIAASSELSSPICGRYDYQARAVAVSSGYTTSLYIWKVRLQARSVVPASSRSCPDSRINSSLHVYKFTIDAIAPRRSTSPSSPSPSPPPHPHATKIPPRMTHSHPVLGPFSPTYIHTYIYVHSNLFPPTRLSLIPSPPQHTANHHTKAKPLPKQPPNPASLHHSQRLSALPSHQPTLLEALDTTLRRSLVASQPRQVRLGTSEIDFPSPRRLHDPGRDEVLTEPLK